jgi:Arc/MetJ family transcription regulator
MNLPLWIHRMMFGKTSLVDSCPFVYTKHMKRTNLVLNADLLDQAVRLFGVKTYSDAVNRALEESLRLMKIRGLADFMGKDVWEGDLKQMRKDARRKKKNS